MKWLISIGRPPYGERVIIQLSARGIVTGHDGTCKWSEKVRAEIWKVYVM